MIKLRIENSYIDGHESVCEVTLDTPDLAEFTDGWTDDPVDTWFADEVYEHTGDGHGINGMGSCYVATVLESDHPEIPTGRSYEWAD